eukprot:m.227534 g.227534  ORF g.227534 m.227534 type:complete len:57 (-) comp17325_c0_seq10:2677-2847(-)
MCDYKCQSSLSLIGSKRVKEALDCREPLKKNRDLTMATLPTSTLDATGLGCDAVHQ